MRHATWVATKIRGRLRHGWLPWETPRGTRWARLASKAGEPVAVEHEPMPKDEREALDAVLSEETDP